MKHLLHLCFLFSSFSLLAQPAPDFTITDSNGEQHNPLQRLPQPGENRCIENIFSPIALPAIL